VTAGRTWELQISGRAWRGRPAAGWPGCALGCSRRNGSRTLIPLTGVALVVFFLIGVALSGSEPSATAPPATVIAWYSSHAGQMKASGYLSSVGVLFGLVFFAYVRTYLSEAGGPRALATAAFGGAVVFAAGGLLGLGAGLALSADPGRLNDAAAQALNLSENYIAGLAINFGVAEAGQLGQPDAGRLETAIIAESRRCAKLRPAHACSSRVSSSPVKTGTSFSVTRGGCSPDIGSGSSSSEASHLKNCCKARYWLLA